MFRKLWKTEDAGGKIWPSIVLAALLLLVFFLFFQKISLTTSDIGRHLANGRAVFSNPGLLFSNFYSYTYPDYPFVNHHWLAGVIYYAIFLIGGFKALTLFNAVLAVLTFWLAFRLAKKSAGFWLPAFLSLPVILILSERVEVRPEIFSYLFLFIVWSILERVRCGGRHRLLWLVLPLLALWANIHIYFFCGLALLAIYAFAEGYKYFFLRSGKLWARLHDAFLSSRAWWLALGGAILACLMNPNTWRGLAYPFRMFANYGYEVAENKTVFYLQHINPDFNYQLFWLLLIISLISLVFAFCRFRKRMLVVMIALFFGLLGCFAVRNIALFGLTVLVTASMNFAVISELDFSFISHRFASFLSRLRRAASRPAIRGTALLILIIIAGLYFFISPFGQNRFLKNMHGWGLEEEGIGSEDFFRKKGLSGPIFNNYDIGSALIFWFACQEQVFVDNRPEAYPASFFAQTYRPMQTEEDVWQKKYKEYGFKAIYFSHTDTTPWAQQFLLARLSDPAWSLVYFDPYTVILLPKEIAKKSGVPAIDFWEFRYRLRQMASAASLKGQFDLASLAVLAGQNNLAAEIYDSIIIRYPGNTRALVALGSYYGAQSNNNSQQQALYYLDRAYHAGYRLPGLYDQRGLIYWSLGQPEIAIENWQQALKKNKKDVPALYYLDQVRQLVASGKLSLPPKFLAD